MFRPVLVLALTLLVSTAHADPILYATAATTGEVTSYCVHPDGSLEPDPLQRINTLGSSPSRLIMLSIPPGPGAPANQVPTQFLYAAENDRVEVFLIGDGGRLTRQGRIPRQPVPNDPGSGLTAMNAHDIEIAQAADGSGPVLYAPERGDNRIATFPIATSSAGGAILGTSTVPLQGFRCSGGTADGFVCDPNAAAGQAGACPCNPAIQAGKPGACPCVPPGKPPDCQTAPPAPCLLKPISDAPGASCVLGPAPADWEDVLAANGVLYAARSTSRGEAVVYGLNAGGNFSDGVLVVNETVVVNGQKFPQENKVYTVHSGALPTPPGSAEQNCTATVTLTTGGNSCSSTAPCAAGQPCVATGGGPELCGDPCDPAANVTTCPAPQVCNVDGRCGFLITTAPAEACTSNDQCTAPQVCGLVNPSTPPDRRPPGQCGTPMTRRAQVQPYSIRRRLNGVSSLILDGNILYVSERFRKAISAFQLCPNSFTPDCTVPTIPGVPDDPCPAGGFFADPKNNNKGQCTDRFRQPRLAKKGGRTESDIRYNVIVAAQGASATTILGSQFNQGRIDGYRLREGNLLPAEPTFRTKKDFRTSPFRMFVYRPPGLNPEESAGVLYVGSGQADRVQAFQLNRDGLPRDTNPFSQTTILTNTFPNDVIVVDLPGSCR
jgi:hypothetical protein